MTKIMDLIRRGTPIEELGEDDKYTALPYPPSEFLSAPKIECSNVADYMYLGTSQEIWDLDVDFPNLAPPFPMFWMEWLMPTKSNSEGKIIDISGGMGRCRAAGLFQGIPADVYKKQFVGTHKNHKEIREAFEAAPQTKWALHVFIFICNNDHIVRSRMRLWFLIGAEGNCLG